MEKIIQYTSQGRSLKGILTKGSSDVCVIFCHGFMGDKDENTLFSTLANTLSSHDIGSFRFDFSGCGESESGPLSLQNMREDLSSTISFLDTLQFDKLFLLGHSLGCAPIISSTFDAHHYFLLSPYFKPDKRRIQLLREELDGNDQIRMKNRFGVEHILTQSFLDEMSQVHLKQELEEKSGKTTVFLGNSDDIMPDSYYKDIKNMKKQFSNFSLLDTDHFYSKNQKQLYKDIVSIIEEIS